MHADTSVGSINYVSLVIAVYALYLCAYWYFRGRYIFRVPEIHVRDNAQTALDKADLEN